MAPWEIFLDGDYCAHSTRLPQVKSPDLWTRIEAEIISIFPFWFIKHGRKAEGA
jgi:hypothetical protein